jgi:hypothetical protein
MVEITKTQKELLDALWKIREKWAQTDSRYNKGIDRLKHELKKMDNDTPENIVVKTHEFFKSYPSRHWGLSKDIFELLLDALNIKKPEKEVSCFFFHNSSYDKRSYNAVVLALDGIVEELQQQSLPRASM